LAGWQFWRRRSAQTAPKDQPNGTLKPRTGNVTQPASTHVVPRILASGDTALVVEFGTTIDRRLSALVLALDHRLADERLPGVVETVPTMRSLMVHYDPVTTSHAALTATIREICTRLDPAVETMGASGRRFRLPACYDPDLAPDLADIAAATGLTTDRVIALHTSVVHRVYMIGFVPGQPYMGDLPEVLRLPRRTTPRTAVPAGSVAIATGLSAIYPIESPGGWHLIARTPARLFDLSRTVPVLLEPGDEVAFAPIDRAEFDRLTAAADDGSWSAEPVAGPS